MFRPISPESKDSGLFYVEQSSKEPSPPGPNTAIVFKSTEMTGNNIRERITISSTAPLRAQIVTIDSDSNEPAMPYGLGRQTPIIPPCLNNLNLSPNPFNILATMAVANVAAEGHDENYSPQITGAFRTVTDIETPDKHTIEGW